MVNGVIRSVEVVGDWLVPLMPDVSKVFFEASVQGSACFTNVQLAAFGAVDHIDDVLSQTVELLLDGKFRLGSLHISAAADERAGVALGFIAWVSPRHPLSALSQFGAYQHIPDVGVPFVGNQWWLVEDFSHFCA